MKKKVVLTSLTLLLGCCSMLIAKPAMHTRVSQAIPVGPKIKVLLLKEAAAALLEVRGTYRVVNKGLGLVLSYGETGKRFVVHTIEEGLRWGEEYPDLNQFTIVPLKEETSIFVDGIQYKGHVTVYHIPNNKIAIVNEIPIEDFVKSSLAIKYPTTTDLSPETKEVVAILERTQAFSKIQSKRPWDVSSEQAKYYGYGVTQQKNDLSNSVEATRFMVLETRDGTIADVVVPKIQELKNQRGNSQKILKDLYPKTKIGITVNPSEVVLK